MVLNVRNVYNLLFETQLPMLFLYVTVYFLLLHTFFLVFLIFIVQILLKAFDSLFNGQFQCDNMPLY